jgi:hypothetical protein
MTVHHQPTVPLSRQIDTEGRSIERPDLDPGARWGGDVIFSGDRQCQ